MSQQNVILERIASIQLTVAVPGAGIPIILASNPYQPSDANSINCPFWINELVLGLNPSDLPIADGLQYINTNIRMVLCVARKEAATDLQFVANETLLWRDAVFAMFALHIKLSAPSVLIKSSTNTNPIVISTNTPHCLHTVDQVSIAGHLVNTNANGVWNSTVIDPVTFSIPAVGNGVGGATGSAIMTQNVDLPFVEEAHIVNWGLIPYEYGNTEFLAVAFPLLVKEFYTQPMLP
jgi:hypothetical protein